VLYAVGSAYHALIYVDILCGPNAGPQQLLAVHTQLQAPHTAICPQHRYARHVIYRAQCVTALHLLFGLGSWEGLAASFAALVDMVACLCGLQEYMRWKRGVVLHMLCCMHVRRSQATVARSISH
jgi:hypothetical protein